MRLACKAVDLKLSFFFASTVSTIVAQFLLTCTEAPSHKPLISMSRSHLPCKPKSCVQPKHTLSQNLCDATWPKNGQVRRQPANYQLLLAHSYSRLRQNNARQGKLWLTKSRRITMNSESSCNKPVFLTALSKFLVSE